MIQDSIAPAITVLTTPAVGSWVAAFYAALLVQRLFQAIRQAIR